MEHEEGATEEECVAGPAVTRAQAKKSDKVHPLKVKEAMSSVDKSTIEDLQMKDSTLKKCFDRIGEPIIRENKEDRSQNTPELFWQGLRRTSSSFVVPAMYAREPSRGVLSRRYHLKKY